jgi:NAD-dependent dihydropyrimidine dehydrogenase PreA subunit
MNVIKIDEDRCKGCKSCYKACWIDVIRWDAVRDRPIIAYPEDCVECGFCEVSCKKHALTVNPSFTDEWPDIYFSRFLTKDNSSYRE